MKSDSKCTIFKPWENTKKSKEEKRRDKATSLIYASAPLIHGNGTRGASYWQD